MLWGVFPGNSLLPVHFVISLIPLTIVWTKAKPRYSRKNKLKINIFYMVGLKIYAWNGTELESLVNVLRIFSGDIGMELRL